MVRTGVRTCECVYVFVYNDMNKDVEDCKQSIVLKVVVVAANVNCIRLARVSIITWHYSWKS